ncbi:MAG: DUF1127 domain-containing protein [Sulfitobacter sp.]
MTASTQTTRRHRFAPKAGPRLPFFQLIAFWRSRNSLANLDARALDDIGVSRAEALKEARKPFWDVPNTWKY